MRMHVPCTYFNHVRQVDCDADIATQTSGPNIGAPIRDCDPTNFNLYTRFDQDPSSSRCNQDTGCAKSAKPVGVRSKHYFNVGLAVGDDGTIVRTLDGGYTWQVVSRRSRSLALLLAAA